MKIITIINSYFQVNTYIFEMNKKVFVIDPGNEIDKIINNLNNKKIDYILLTHGHMDHIYSVKKLTKIYNCEVYASRKDINYINGTHVIDPFFDKSNYNFLFKDYEEFNNMEMEIINTPGHSKGSVCIYLKSKNILFSGDTLFNENFGRFDFVEGNLLELKNSINKLFLLDENIIIYPGHGPKTSIKYEKFNNIIKFY